MLGNSNSTAFSNDYRCPGFTENWNIKDANKLGVPGDNYPNRVINTGVSGKENIETARNALYKIIGNNQIMAEREIQNIKGGLIYELENGTTITFRPESSINSDFMPKITINNEVDGTITNLIFYK